MQRRPAHWASGKLAHRISVMINSIFDLAYQNEDGTYVMPAGPCMAWPKERGMPGPALVEPGSESKQTNKKIKASIADMTKSLIENSVNIVKTGTLTKEARDERLNTCIQCEHFIEKSKRCSECGCFMEAKTWITGATCPVGKW